MSSRISCGLVAFACSIASSPVRRGDHPVPFELQVLLVEHAAVLELVGQQHDAVRLRRERCLDDAIVAVDDPLHPELVAVEVTQPVLAPGQPFGDERDERALHLVVAVVEANEVLCTRCARGHAGDGSRSRGTQRPDNSMR
jgi:hypothetical protein